MFFRKKSYPKTKRKSIIAHFNGKGNGLLPRTVYNWAVVGDKLKTADGFCFYTATDKPIIGLIAPFYDEVLYFTEDAFYRFNPQTYFHHKVLDGYWPNPTYEYNSFSERIGITSGMGSTIGYKVLVPTVADELYDEGMTSLTYYRDRFFGLMGNLLHYSAAGDYFTWESQIEIPLVAKAIMSTQDGVYLFGKDLYLFQFDDDEINSKITLVYSNLGNVLPHSIQKYGKGFLFMADGYVQYFNGSTVKKIVKLCEWNISNDKVSSAVYKGLYYVSFDCNGSGKNNRVAAVDVANQQVVTLYNFEAEYLSANEYKLFASCGDEISYLYYDACTDFYWESYPYNFGNDLTLKSLQEFTLVSSNVIFVTLKTEKESRRFIVAGGNKLRKVPLHGSFKRLTVILQADEMAEISHFGIVANVVEED